VSDLEAGFTLVIRANPVAMLLMVGVVEESTATGVHAM